MTLLKAINTPKAPNAVGPYSQAISDGFYVYVSGQLPLDLTTGKLIEGDIRKQTKYVLDYLEEVLKAGNSNLAHVMRIEIFLKDLQHFSIVNEEYEKKFIQPVKPARQTIQAILPKNAEIEISCIAKVIDQKT